MRPERGCPLIIGISLGALLACQAAEAAAKKIQDNSFLLEEAYNQEPGVIQHIQNFWYVQNRKTWIYSFTQEWPVPGRTHQLSCLIPVNHVDNPDPRTGFGDIGLNYRYQLLYRRNAAVAPRLTLLLPTGDDKKGLGSGAWGWQTNLPISVELDERWVSHWNMGFTLTPRSREPGGAHADTTAFNLGASLIRLVSENFNLMLEGTWNSTQSPQPDGGRQRSENFFLNPGARFALNYPSGLQVVPGIAFPIGLGPSERSYGFFLYLSFEHPAFKPRN